MIIFPRYATKLFHGVRATFGAHGHRRIAWTRPTHHVIATATAFTLCPPLSISCTKLHDMALTHGARANAYKDADMRRSSRLRLCGGGPPEMSERVRDR